MDDPLNNAADLVAYRRHKAAERRRRRLKEARAFEPRPYKAADTAFARRLEVGFRMLGRAF